MDIDYKIVEQAYKKLKSSVYFDKTQLILRNSIVEYETKDDIDNQLKKYMNRYLMKTLLLN